MASSRGLIAINNVANSSKQNSFGTFTNLGLNSLIIAARVINIVLDETNPRFKLTYLVKQLLFLIFLVFCLFE